MVGERISVDPSVCGGKPCIKGTRIMVKDVLGLMAGGYSLDQILETYSQLKAEDVVDAFQYASQVIDQDKHIPRAS